MITFLKTEAKPHWEFDIEIHSMTPKGHEVKTCEINNTDLYKITFFNQQECTLKTYTGKVARYVLKCNYALRSSDDFIFCDDNNLYSIKSLQFDCSEESESKTITIDICDIRDIKRYSEEAFEEISSSTIKEWK